MNTPTGMVFCAACQGQFAAPDLRGGDDCPHCCASSTLRDIVSLVETETDKKLERIAKALETIADALTPQVTVGHVDVELTDEALTRIVGEKNANFKS